MKFAAEDFSSIRARLEELEGRPAATTIGIDEARPSKNNPLGGLRVRLSGGGSAHRWRFYDGSAAAHGTMRGMVQPNDLVQFMVGRAHGPLLIALATNISWRQDLWYRVLPWKDWDGSTGIPPCNPAESVLVLLRGGLAPAGITPMQAKCYSWKWSSACPEGDIVRYALVPNDWPPP